MGIMQKQSVHNQPYLIYQFHLQGMISKLFILYSFLLCILFNCTGTTDSCCVRLDTVVACLILLVERFLESMHGMFCG